MIWSQIAARVLASSSDRNLHGLWLPAQAAPEPAAAAAAKAACRNFLRLTLDARSHFHFVSIVRRILNFAGLVYDASHAA